MIAFILKWLGDEALGAIMGLIQSELEKRNLIAQGQAQQAAKETASSEAVQADIAAAEANAPKTPDAALDRLRGGTA